MIGLFYANGIYSNTSIFQGHMMQSAKTTLAMVKRLFHLLLVLLCSFSTATVASDSLYEKLQVTDLEGHSVDLSQHKGGLVLVNFWATWCPPCVKEMPSLQRLQQQFEPSEFRVVLINLGQTATTVNSFFKEQTFEFNLPVYLDDKGRAFTALGIEGMPSSYLLNSQGYPIETIVGSREWDHPGNIDAVRQLISSPPTTEH